MKKSIIFILCCIIVIILIVLTFTIVKLAIPEDPTIINVGYSIENIAHAPIMVAGDMSFFDKYELKVNLIPLKGGKEIRDALATGKIDIGSTGVSQLFIPILKGAPIKIISFSASSSTLVFVRPDNTITKFSDFEGKSVSSRVGSSTNLIFRSVLKKEGVDVSKIMFVDLDKTTAPIALINKKIVDAAVVDNYEDSLYYDVGAILFEDWVKKGYTKELFPKTVIAVNSDFLESNSDDVNKFLMAIIDAQRYILTNPVDSANIVAENMKRNTAGATSFTMEDVIDSWKTTKYVLWQDPSAIVESSEIAKEMGDLLEPLTKEQIFDLRFEEVLKNAQAEIYK